MWYSLIVEMLSSIIKNLGNKLNKNHNRNDVTPKALPSIAITKDDIIISIYRPEKPAEDSTI